MAPIPKLDLTLLGTFEVHIDGQPANNFRSNKAQALLCYLAVSGRAHSRSALSGLLWGDTPEEQARTSLRQTLSNLTELCPACLTITRQNIAFAHNDTCAVDAERFEAVATRLAVAPGLVDLHAELALYRGDFLEGFYVRNAPDFETWMLGVRARYREMALQAFYVVALYWMERGETTQAIFYSRRLLDIEPWHEDAHRQLMQLLVQTGQRAAALEQYRLCRQLLADELGVEPDEATTQLYMRIRAGDFAKEVGSRSIVPASSEGGKGEPVAVPHNLRLSAASFVGRAQELEVIAQRLADPTCRLLTLAGAGGIGKSRLALHAAHALLESERAAANFRHGVYYVALAAVVSADLLPSAIADALGVHLSDADVQGQLLIFLSDKALLIILDNFEHLMDGMGYLTAMLEAAPHLKLLVTSREMLHAQEEWLLPVERLPFPAEDDAVGVDAGPEAYDAVMLFVQRARQAQPGFSFADERKSVLRICRLTDGFPLAIELASAMLRILPCAQLVRELEDEAHGGLDLLAGSIRNVPDRHDSMRGGLQPFLGATLRTRTGTFRPPRRFPRRLRPPGGNADWRSLVPRPCRAGEQVASQFNARQLDAHHSARWTL